MHEEEFRLYHGFKDVHKLLTTSFNLVFIYIIILNVLKCQSSSVMRCGVDPVAGQKRICCKSIGDLADKQLTVIFTSHKVRHDQQTSETDQH